MTRLVIIWACINDRLKITFIRWVGKINIEEFWRRQSKGNKIKSYNFSKNNNQLCNSQKGVNKDNVLFRLASKSCSNINADNYDVLA